MTDTASSSARYLCAMLCLFLVLLFAAMQGTNALDRIQHMSAGAAPHEHHHLFLSELTMDQEDRLAEARLEAEDADPGMGGAMPVHHHHHADHGASLPTPFLTHEAVFAISSLRIGIPQGAAVIGMVVHAPERPPKIAAIAA
ncbi:MAG: hypothetical protein QM690_02585 [Sphingobium sp.]